MHCEGCDRSRDRDAEKVILTSPLFNTGDTELDRQNAADWGRRAFTDDVSDPYTPYLIGPTIFLDHGCHWPTDGAGKLLELNDQKGALPENADLAFGITLENVSFHGIKRTNEGGFFALISATDVWYAEKTN